MKQKHWPDIPAVQTVTRFQQKQWPENVHNCQLEECTSSCKILTHILFTVWILTCFQDQYVAILYSYSNMKVLYDKTRIAEPYGTACLLRL